MNHPSLNLLLLCAGAMVLVIATHGLAAEPTEIPLWPADKLTKLDQPETASERSTDPAMRDRAFRNVSNPTVIVYLPADANGPVPAVLICPGGAYAHLAIDKEGHDVARWLSRIGVAGVVLKYRPPRPDLTQGQPPWPVQDAKRAMRLVRHRAGEWKIDPARIGVMGFSAGGHLAAVIGTEVDAGQADAADAIDRQSSRPDFMILVYPLISMREPLGVPSCRNAFLGRGADAKLIDQYSPELHVTARTPPAFLVHAKDDSLSPHSILFAETLRKAGVECELQLYAQGGHAYGLGVRGGEVATWPQRCEAWLRRMKLLEPGAATEPSR